MRKAIFAVGFLVIAGCGGGDAEKGDEDHGRTIFVQQGCILCHSVNGIGGRVAPALDVDEETPQDPFDFAAEILSGAYAMSALQKAELGYTINLTGGQLRDIAAFAGSPTAQQKLVIEDVPMSMREAFLTDEFWEAPDLSGFLPAADVAPASEQP